MAVVALNTFKTIRKSLTTSNVGIYTCPSGVASIVILAQVTNVSTGTTTYSVSAFHSRNTESPTDYKFANNVSVPPNDSVNLIPDGRLVLETGDSIKVSSDSNNELDIVLSVLETAKG
jgi:hypothetical protein